MGEDVKAGRRADGILVLGKVSAVLDLFADGLERAGPSEVASKLGQNKSTTFRLLNSMERIGLLDRHADGTYGLGLRLMELGALVNARLDLRRVAEPALRRLRQATGQTGFLIVRHDLQATCIDRIAGEHVDVMALQLGGVLPLHVGAGPRALLASLDAPDLERYLSRAPFAPLTAHSLTTAEALRRDVSETRQRGYSLSLEDVTLGVAAIGAPIADGRGQVRAAISIAGLRQEYDEGREPLLAAHVLAAAGEVSRALGARGDWRDQGPTTPG